MVAWLIGMANAWVAGCCDCVPNAVVEMLLEAAVFMPTTSPWVLTSGPPESPGWMPALVWIRPWSRSALPADSSEAVMVLPVAVTLPVATDGVPPLPPALPSATTFWPLCTPEELRLTVCSPEAFTSWSTATSRVLS